MANNYSTKLTADTSQHDKALKKSANEIYKYSKSVDNAKKSLGTMAKKFGAIGAAIGVSAGLVNQFVTGLKAIESVSDSAARTQEALTFSIKQFFMSLSTGSVDSFLEDLGNIITKAKDAYNAIDDLRTFQSFNNLDLAKNKTKQDDYELTIKKIKAGLIKDPTGKLLKEAQAGLQAAQQERLGFVNQELKKYDNAISKAEEKIQARLKTDHAKQLYQKYTANGASYSDVEDAYNKAKQAFNDIKNEWNEYATMGDGQNLNPGAHREWYKKNKERFNRVQDEYEIMKQIKDLEQDIVAKKQLEIEKEMVKQSLIASEAGNVKALKPISTTTPKNKETKETEPEILSKLEELKKQEAELKKDIEMLYTIDDNGAPSVLDPQKLDELNKKLKETQNQIELIEHAINPPVNTNFDIPSSGLYSTREEYDAFMAEVEKATQEAQSIIDSHFEDMYSNIKEISSSMNGLIGVFEEWQSLAENPNADFGDYFKTITSTIFTTIDAIVNIVTAIKTLSTISQAFKAAETLMDGVVRSAALAEMAAKVTAFYAELGPFGVAPAAATIAAYNALALPKFANGGIYEGATTVGDHGIARVNAGEMILNTRQQGNLFKLLDGVASLQPATSNGNVHFKIAGADLVGVLANYTDKKNRIM